jgi:hypothetical protein
MRPRPDATTATTGTQGTIVAWEHTATVTCDTHGPMSLRERNHWWQCRGFDGEGCAAGYSGIVYSGDAMRGSVPGVTVGAKDGTHMTRNSHDGR